MLFTSITRTVSMLTMTCLLSAGLVAGENVTAKQLQLEKEGIQLISQLEDVARDIHYNSDRLNSSPHLSKWTHRYHLAQIKELVNDGLRPALTRLEQIQPELKDWHQDTIDKMLSSAKDLAGDTNSAMLNHNENSSLPVLLNPAYKDLLSKIDGHAQTLMKTADAAVNYASAHERAEEAGLRLPKH